VGHASLPSSSSSISDGLGHASSSLLEALGNAAALLPSSLLPASVLPSSHDAPPDDADVRSHDAPLPARTNDDGDASLPHEAPPPLVEEAHVLSVTPVTPREYALVCV